ncbi:MAG: helix-turn-helix domain-containing protein [Saprospiraceae bacterium]
MVELNRLRVVLAEKRVTNRTLASKLGVGETTVSRWSTNAKQPGLETLYRIAEALEVDPCDLLVREPISDNEDTKAE